MKITYVHCGEETNIRDPRSYQHYWTSKLPVGLLAQLVERCTGIAEVMGSNPVRAWIFLGLNSTTS